MLVRVPTVREEAADDEERAARQEGGEGAEAGGEEGSDNEDAFGGDGRTLPAVRSKPHTHTHTHTQGRTIAYTHAQTTIMISSA